MKRTSIVVIALLLTAIGISAQGDGRPTCRNCPSTYIPKAEIQAYIDRAIANKIIDQQVRAVDVGRINVGGRRHVSWQARGPGAEFRG